MTYEIQSKFLSGKWENCWTLTDEDGNESLQIFDTEEEAQQELEGFFNDVARCVEKGFMREVYPREDFRIVKV